MGVFEDLPYNCNKHPNIPQQTTLDELVHLKFGCRLCFLDNIRGDNYNEMSEQYKYRLSTQYRDWRKQILKRDNYTCQCCGSGSNLNAHHLFNVADNIELGIDLDNGITLCQSCHAVNRRGSFHHTYGYRHNTPEQLQEYISRYKNGEFDELRLSNKL